MAHQLSFFDDPSEYRRLETHDPRDEELREYDAELEKYVFTREPNVYGVNDEDEPWGVRKPTTEATTTLPGTNERIAVYEARYAAREELFHVDDATHVPAPEVEQDDDSDDDW